MAQRRPSENAHSGPDKGGKGIRKEGAMWPPLVAIWLVRDEHAAQFGVQLRLQSRDHGRQFLITDGR